VSANARRILIAVPQSDWKRPAEHPHTSWLAGEEQPIIPHPQCADATELALDRPLSWHWRGHSGGYWQKAELLTKMVQAEQ